MGLLALRPLGAAEPGPHPLLAYGTEAQKARYVPRLARREILGAFALTEPEAGSDAASLKTRAHREGDFYVLEGQKTFISHANVAEVFLVFAKTDPEKGAKGITCFLVERGDGVKTSPLKGKLGLRAADTGMVFLDGVRVPKDRVLGKEGEGFRIALSTLDTGRISLAAGAVGLMQRALDLSLAYTRERKQFGKPIAQFQLVQEHLAAMKLDLGGRPPPHLPGGLEEGQGGALHPRGQPGQALRLGGGQPGGLPGHPGPRGVRLL